MSLLVKNRIITCGLFQSKTENNGHVPFVKCNTDNKMTCVMYKTNDMMTGDMCEA